ncbi:sugar ABC transporter permease [uncultured Sphaerochaeta sp.]|uniref:carbohydrate ABC transporter permease n=1 Tax=uncultured Sphaerochaeta sp. TaxID=886478 RepID=UPI002A0A2FDA|nr:sugar ABC transporter permease [uncultured Sphaerochaeta sp.]
MVIIVFYLVVVALLCMLGIVFINKHFHQHNRRQLSPATKRKMEPYLFLFPTIVLLVLLFGYPLVNCSTMAFQNYKLTSPGNIKFNGFDNFKKLFSESDFSLIVKNSLIYVFLSVSGQFLLGLTLALALQKRFPFRGLYQAIIFLPWSFSAFVIGLMHRWSFNGEYGVVNDILLRFHLISEKIAWLGTPGFSLAVVIIAMIWMGIPFFAIMILASLQSIPKEVYEASYIDGCGVLRRFFEITFPYIKPTVIVTILLRTIWIFNSFDLIVVITNGGPANYSQTLPSYMYTKAFSSYDFGLASALGVILMVSLILYVTIFLKVTQYNKAGDF